MNMLDDVKLEKYQNDIKKLIEETKDEFGQVLIGFMNEMEKLRSKLNEEKK